MANVSQKQLIEISTVAKHSIALEPTSTERPSATSGISHRLRAYTKSISNPRKAQGTESMDRFE